MNDTDFWDDYEYNFFMDLEDEDKLLYIYDLMIGDFTSEYFGGDDSDYEFEFEPDNELRTNVLALFDEHGFLSITGPTEDVLDKVAADMMMNGMILTEREVTIVDKGVILLSFNVVGRGTPISLN